MHRARSAFELDNATEKRRAPAEAIIRAAHVTRYFAVGLLVVACSLAVFAAGYSLGSRENAPELATNTELVTQQRPPGAQRRSRQMKFPTAPAMQDEPDSSPSPTSRTALSVKETGGARDGFAQLPAGTSRLYRESSSASPPSASAPSEAGAGADAGGSAVPPNISLSTLASSPSPQPSMSTTADAPSSSASPLPRAPPPSPLAAESKAPREIVPPRASCAPPRAAARLPGGGVYAGVALATWEDLTDRRFGWREWRSVESFFYHHPAASLRVLSDSLPLELFAPLQALGYDATVLRVDWAGLRTPETAEVVDFWLARRGEVVRHPRFRAAKQADLVRVLFALARGGLYFDLDSIFVAPLPAALSFVTYWRGVRRVGAATNPRLPGAPIVEKVHNGIFGFTEPAAPFLRLVLPLFLRCEGPPCQERRAWAPELTSPLLHPAWDSAGPPLFSRAVAAMAPNATCGLTLLRDTAVIGWWVPADAVALSTRPMDAATSSRLRGLLRNGYAAHLYTSHTGALAGVHPQSLFGDLLQRFALAPKHAGAAAAALLPRAQPWNATAAAAALREAARPSKPRL